MAKSYPPLLFFYLLAFSCSSLLTLAIRPKGEALMPLPLRQEGQQQGNECQFDSINALEPTNKVRSEAGVTEFWDPNEDQFQCAGVAFMRRFIQPKGLLLPYFRSSPELYYVLRGKGIRGLSIPGCPETFQSVSREGREFQDEHQRLWRFREGDIFAVPAGVVHWLFNDGDEDLILVTLVDTSNEINQLDQRFPRGFFLAGNPQQEFQDEEGKGGEDVKNMLDGFDPEILQEAFGVPRETIERLRSNKDDKRGQIVRAEQLRVIRPPTVREDEQWEERHRGEGRGSRGEEGEEWEEIHGGRGGKGRGSRGEEGEEWEEIHGGRGGKGRGRGNRGEEGEEWEEIHGGRGGSRGGKGRGGRSEEGEEWEEIHGGQGRGSRGGKSRGGRGEEGEEWEEIHGGRGRGSRGEEGEEWEEIHGGRGEGRGSRGGQEEWEEIHGGRGGEGRGSRGKGRGGRGTRGDREREEIHQGGRGEGRGFSKSDYNLLESVFSDLEQPICFAKLRENIDDPSRSDIFVPQAGRLKTLNSYNLPVLRSFRLSVEKGVLYKNALMAPHWNLNAHSVIYATRGSARVQIVNERGEDIFQGELKENQLVVAPQNFALVKQAGDEGFEWVSFKTNDNAAIQTIAGRTSFLKALPIEVVMSAYQVSRAEADKLKNERRETVIFAGRSKSGRGDRESDRRAVA